jgi:hypothetical protein
VLGKGGNTVGSTPVWRKMNFRKNIVTLVVAVHHSRKVGIVWSRCGAQRRGVLNTPKRPRIDFFEFANRRTTALQLDETMSGL